MSYTPNGSEAQLDVIADIHGEADALHRLLVKLDYFEDRNGTYNHRGARKAIFVGDFIDRGPEQREVLSVVRKMIDAGTAYAVMGNHELNAIAYSTPDDGGGFYRPHSEKNQQQQHATFLAQFGEGSAEYFETISWFKSLPLWFEVDGLGVVHACWHQASMQELVSGGEVTLSGQVRGDARSLRQGSV